MMMEYGPCASAPMWLPALNVVMNCFQAVILALLAQRAVRKNREDRNGRSPYHS